MVGFLILLHALYIWRSHMQEVVHNVPTSSMHAHALFPVHMPGVPAAVMWWTSTGTMLPSAVVMLLTSSFVTPSCSIPEVQSSNKLAFDIWQSLPTCALWPGEPQMGMKDETWLCHSGLASHWWDWRITCGNASFCCPDTKGLTHGRWLLESSSSELP